MSSRTASTLRRAPCLLLIALFGALPLRADPLADALAAGAASATKGVDAQKAADEAAEDNAALAAEYAVIERQLDGLGVYNARLERQLAEQKQRLADIERASEGATGLAREMVPLLERMVDSLEAFVALDKPFRQEERRARIAALRVELDRGSATVASRYRAVLEAYRAELDYGRGLSAYAATVEADGTPFGVTLLQVGRLALYAQSEDGETTLYWDEGTRAWARLDDGDYARSVAAGIRVARGDLPDTLLRLPLPAPEQVAP